MHRINARCYGDKNKKKKEKSLNVLSKDLIILIKNKKIKICTVSTHVAMVIKINEIRKSLNVIRTLTILIKNKRIKICTVSTHVAMVIKIKEIRKSLNVLSKDLIILIKNKKIKICTVSTHVAMVVKIKRKKKKA